MLRPVGNTLKPSRMRSPPGPGGMKPPASPRTTASSSPRLSAQRSRHLRPASATPSMQRHLSFDDATPSRGACIAAAGGSSLNTAHSTNSRQARPSASRREWRQRRPCAPTMPARCMTLTFRRLIAGSSPPAIITLDERLAIPARLQCFGDHRHLRITGCRFTKRMQRR